MGNKRDLGRGFSTPMMMKVAAGRQDLVLNGPNRVAGYDPKSGKELWRCDRSDAKDQAKFGEPMPVSDGQLIFILSGRPGPCQALRLPGEGDVTKSHVAWQEERKNTAMFHHLCFLTISFISLTPRVCLLRLILIQAKKSMMFVWAMEKIKPWVPQSS